jgi:serine/threonine protein kinase
MAEIFRATQSVDGLSKELVIKRILPSLSTDEQFVKMFVEEARLCEKLKHPNIVQVYDLGEFDAQYYIAMEYVHGRDLLKTLAACAKKRIAFPTDLALYIVMEVLKGLDYAHNLAGPDGAPLGIIHRDVSPSNVLLSFDGKVKLGDFGIAKATIRERTATGILKGKFGYMAPEQVMGRPIDHRADVFAVGILLYELLTGHRLFAGRSDLAVLERVRDALIDPPPRHYRPDLSGDLEGIVLKSLAREPHDRFQSTSELHDAIYDYTFRKGVVVSPRMLARFLHDLFLTDETEEQYSYPQPRGKNGHASLLGKAVVSTGELEVSRESPPSSRAPPSRGETSNDRAASSSSGFAMPRVRELSIDDSDPSRVQAAKLSLETPYEEDPTEDPSRYDFDEEATRGGSGDLGMLPFPGMEQRRGSSFASEEGSSSSTELPDVEGEEHLDDPTQNAGLEEARGRAAPSPPLEEIEELSQSTTGSGLELLSRRPPMPVVRSPAEARAIRRSMERTVDDRAEPPIKSAATEPSERADSVSETVDADSQGIDTGVESSQGDIERTDLLDSGLHALVRPASESLEEIHPGDLIELSGTGTAQRILKEYIDDEEISSVHTIAQPDKDDAGLTSPSLDVTSDDDDDSVSWEDRTRDERSAREAARADTAAGPPPSMEVDAAAVLEHALGPGEVSELFAASLLDDNAVLEPQIRDQISASRDEISAGDSASNIRDEDIESAEAASSGAQPAADSGAEEREAGVHDTIDPSSEVITGRGRASDKPRSVIGPLDEPAPTKSGSVARRSPARSSRSRVLSETPRRRVAAKAILSVVNPGGADEATGFGQLAPQDGEVHARGELPEDEGIARLDTNPNASRGAAGGVGDALSEAAQMHEEIEEIRSSSRSKSRPAEELTAAGDLAGLLGDMPGIVLSDPTATDSPKSRGAGRSASPRSISQTTNAGKLRRRFQSHGVVLFDDQDETINAKGQEAPKAPVLTDLGRLEDSGASDLFGALSLIEQQPFDPNKDDSGANPPAQSSGRRGSQAPIVAPSVAAAREASRAAAPIMAPSVAAELRARGASTARDEDLSDEEVSQPSEVSEPSREQSGIELRFERSDPSSESEERVPRFGGAAARPKSPVVLDDNDPIDDDGGTQAPEIVSEVVDHTGESDHDLDEHKAEDPTPAALDFGPASASFQHEETPALEDMPSKDHGIYAVYGGPENRAAQGRLVSDSFDLGFGGAPRNVRPPEPASRAPSPREPTPEPQDEEADRRLRAVVERQRPAKEVKRTSSPHTPPPNLMPTSTAYAPSLRAPEPLIRPAAPVAQNVAKGPVPSHKNPPKSAKKPFLTTKTAMVILVIVLAVTSATILTIQVFEWSRPRSALAIAPVDQAKPEEPAKPTPAKEEPKKAEPKKAEKKAEPKKEEPKREVAKEDPPPKKAEPKPERPEKKKAEERKAEAKRDDSKATATAARTKPQATPAATAASNHKKFPSNTGGIQVDCKQPVEVTISKSGTYSDITKKVFKLQPGTYNVVLKKADGTSNKSFVRVVAGEANLLACD